VQDSALARQCPAGARASVPCLASIPKTRFTEHRREDRALAWLNRNRRLARDFEATVDSAITWLYFASVKLMLRRPPAA
jgi:hypothetical protein